MNQQTINAVVEEMRQQLSGRFLGKVFQLTQFTLVLDFRLRDGGYLLISVDPKQPRLHLINRRLKDLEKQSIPLSGFAQSMRSNIGGAEIASVSAHASERVIELDFQGEDEVGNAFKRTLVAQLTGRSANLLLLNHDRLITHSLRTPRGEGQQVGDQYLPPPSQKGMRASEPAIERGNFPSLSEALDDHFQRIQAAEDLLRRIKAARDRNRHEIAQRLKLKRNLEQDLINHGEAEQHKRIGELLLANLSTADRNGSTVRIKDYFSVGEPVLELELDEKKSLQEAAAESFARYTKSKRASQEISRRMIELEKELAELQRKQLVLSETTGQDAAAALATIQEELTTKTPVKKQKSARVNIPGVRRYRSSDGYEILVGRAARTNDQLTFKVAKPHDLWLHAADYPGSHVVVRNTGRNEIPQRTMIEAAQLAAKFSQAGDDAKVNVHYAQRKFLSKPKGASPGLVRMSSFKTITVTPGENVERILTKE